MAESDHAKQREMREKVHIADEIRAMLENPHIREAFSKVEKAYLARATELSPHKRHDELRYRYLLAVTIIREVASHLTIAIRDGEIEKSKIESLDKFKRREGLW